MNKAVIISTLCERKRKDDELNVRDNMDYKSILRFSKFVNSVPFGEACCRFNGYCNSKSITFYFRRKKRTLHRLLYINFKGDIDNNEYIKYTCGGADKCCNIDHLAKCKYKTFNSKAKYPEVCRRVLTKPKSLVLTFD